MLPTFYENQYVPKNQYSEMLSEITNLPWCRPPSGIPGNRTPRNVAVIGDGSTVRKINGKIGYIYNRNIRTKEFAYPMFQTAKNCTAIYKSRKIPKGIANIILNLRKSVKKLYGDSVSNVNDMFNVVVCNYYTEHSHQINAHRDDERWLELNQRDADGQLKASIIASLTIYPDDYNSLREFEIQNDETGYWEKFYLENNSVLFFSNHNHRVKPLSKKKENVKRYNLTFRTVSKDLIGTVGYSNFYRYMSIPYKLILTPSNLEKKILYEQSLRDSNTFNDKTLFQPGIQHEIIDEQEYKNNRLENKHKLESLPQYVKPLCSNFHIC